MDNDKLLAFNSRKANSTNIWLLFLFLGWSYGSLGKIGLQILYYFTLGGFGVWVLIRLFTLNGAIKKYNRTIANELKMDAEDMNLLNLM
tara:strand:- start:95 stop:361 length:267 start_codon:yes stop_codon:yes gene_type:complete